ncbi:MAG: hypothetical protein ACP5NW_02660, partial [Candidatus Woesearchaeota archaeon]
MGKNTRIVLFTIVLAFLILVPFVLSADLLEPIFSSFRGTNLGKTYNNYTAFIDAILYMWFFVVLAKGILKDKLSNAVAVSIGVMLAIAMAVFETNTGFNLGKLAPFALLILFLAVGIFLYNFLSQVISSKWAAVSVAFLIIYSLLQFVAPAAIAWINKVGWLGTMLSLFYMIAVIGLIYSLISMIGGIRGRGSSSGGGLFGGRGSGRNNDNDNDRNITDENKKTWLERSREREATANIAKLDVDLSTLNNNVAQLAKLESEIESRELNNRRVQIKTLQDLQNALNGAWRVQAELQKAYRNISRPEYANNQTAIDSITSGSQQLSEFVLKVEKLLMLLKEKFEKEVTDEEKEVQVRNELENSLKKIDATVANYTEATLKISKVMNRLKKAGAPDDYTQILKVIDDRAKLFSNL